ncbi:MAG: UvrD-helicase domain-containing protein [bacterium]
MKEILDNLTPEQKQAVVHKSGPLLIVAGAGTGKTTVITRRIAYLISKKIAKPSEILALTFTEKAAAEMEERVDILVPYGYVDTWISTFHAFGDRVLGEHALDLGLALDFKVMSRAEQAVFIRENIFEFDLDILRPLGNPTGHIDALIRVFSRIADENLSPEEYFKYCQNAYSKAGDKDEKKQTAKDLEVAKAYMKYQELKQVEGLIDFSDQIILVLKLFKDHPNILKKYQDQFKYILVDEYQDTNYAQNLLVETLSASPYNICVVGDDDQSIYRFRGAAISNILDFKKKFPKAGEIVLKQNFRSGQAILDSAYKLIQNNNPDRLEIVNKIDKKLVSTKKSDIPKHLVYMSISEASMAVTKEIKDLSKKYALRDIAILVRANISANNYLGALKTIGIPAIYSGKSGLYSQSEIIILINIMKAIYGHSDPLAFYHFLVSDINNLKISEIMPILAESSSTKRPLEEYLRKNLQKIDYDTDLKNKLQKILASVDNYRKKSLKLSAGQLLYDFLVNSKYLEKLTRESSVENEIKINNIAKFFDRIHAFETATSDKSLAHFIEYLDTMIEVGEDPSTAEIDSEIDAVNVLTVHAAKGLEYKVVFMVDLVADRFPTRRKSEGLTIPEGLIKERLPEGDWHIQEERRLFYVGMTRAKEKLYMVSAKDYGGVRAKKLSPFVLEALGTKAQLDKTVLTSPEEKLKRFKYIDESIKLPTKFFEENRIVLSYWQIDDYLTCPLKFKYVHIIRIPILKHHPLVYGTAIHAAIEHYFKHKIRDEKIEFTDIVRVFEESWENTGFISREHEEARIEQGKKTLKKFITDMEKIKDIPSRVEEPFKVNLQIDNKKIKLKGRFDAIYERNKEIEIRDFKSSDIREQEKADQRAKSSMQLDIYALSYFQKTGKYPIVSLYFVESGIIAKRQVNKKNIDKLEDKISKVVQGLEKQDYRATPGKIQCDMCPYQDICPKAIK